MGKENFAELVLSMKAYASEKVIECCENNEDTETIRYWVGYRDGLDAILKKIQEQ